MKGGILGNLATIMALTSVLATCVLSDVYAQERIAEDAAVARTRKQVQMLDDLYKTAIVLVTENYVDES